MATVSAEPGFLRGLPYSRIVLLGLILTGTAYGQYEPPADYYDTVTGNPATLKSELHLIISDNYYNGTFPDGSGHIVRSYGDARYGLAVTDKNPDQPGDIILAYDGASVAAAWDLGVTWNREHRWPRSWGVEDSGPDYSDMHALVPCSPTINDNRSNASFGLATSSGGYGFRSSYWYPGDTEISQPDPDFANDVGDVARAMFYMAVRYDGNESETTDLELKNGPAGGSEGGDLAALSNWHYRDAPSMHERRRNHAVFSNQVNPSYHQGNRNPFVDHPEYVWAIFGEGQNDSKLYVGSTVPPDGASSDVVDFGGIVEGSAPPAPLAVQIHKTGDAPTYFKVSASGCAVTSSEGPFNAFASGPKTMQLFVDLDADALASPGLKTGIIIVDNTDLTDAGTGTGALDGDDIITVMVNVTPDSIVFGDKDQDGDVDQEDYGYFQRCITGDLDPRQVFDPVNCSSFDFDADSDVDEQDFSAFQACYSGANVPVDPMCDTGS